MAKYLMCPDCGNTQLGTEIVRCKECKFIFCRACEVRRSSQAECPNCGKKCGVFYGN